jgi:hypothetical protein
MSCSILTKQGKECSREGYYAGCCFQHANEKLKVNTEDLKLVNVVKAEDGKHKWVAVFEKEGRTKHVPFGAYGMKDYTLSSGNKESNTDAMHRRDRYLERHHKDLRTLSPDKAGMLSYFILWGKSRNIKENIQDYKRMFGI